MKRFKKTILSLIIGISALLGEFVSADEIKIEQITYDNSTNEIIEREEIQNIGLTPVYPFDNTNCSLYGLESPSSSKVWNLHTQGQRPLEGESNISTLYSEYNFTGVQKMNIFVTWAIWYDVELKLMKYRPILSDPQVGSTMIHHTSADYPNRMTQFIITGLDPSAKYYIKVSGPVYFKGYVEEAY